MWFCDVFQTGVRICSLGFMWAPWLLAQKWYNYNQYNLIIIFLLVLMYPSEATIPSDDPTIFQQERTRQPATFLFLKRMITQGFPGGTAIKYQWKCGLIKFPHSYDLPLSSSQSMTKKGRLRIQTKIIPCPCV